MPAVFGVHLREAEHLTVGELASHLFADRVEITNLIITQCETFCSVICCDVIDIKYFFRFFPDGEERLIQILILSLQHGIECSCFIFRPGSILLDACDTFDTHVLCDLHRTGAPGSDHLATGADKLPVDTLSVEHLCLSKKPGQFFFCFLGEGYLGLYGNYTLRGGTEK